MKPIPPCYDSVNKQDCPDRRPGCHSKCKKWGMYEKNRNRDYQDRYDHEDYYTDAGERSKAKRRKEKYRDFFDRKTR